jgi:23S rRNA (uracil1939-C5)-methyltransferase
MIERILPGGLGIGHAEGRTVMVPLAAPGDRLRVRVERERGNVAFAAIEEIINPSPVRIEPPCPYFGRCGGCDFQQLKYEAQLEAKREIVNDCLRRIGGLASIPNFQIIAAPNPWHYRARAQWQYDVVRQRLGYFESGSRRVCDVAECAVLVPELQLTLESLRAQMQNGLLPEDARDFRAVAGDNEISIAPAWGSDPAVRERASSSHDGRVRNVTRAIHGETYILNAESFFQTNVDLLPQMIDYAVADASGRAALDLYCGVGLFTVPLSRKFDRVIGVEDDDQSAKFARANLANANLTNAEIMNADVGNWLQGYRDRSPDFLLLDPPRAGAESKVIKGIIELAPPRVCYVSCDPATLARDLKKLIAGGYTLDSLVAFDMFPQTHHVETVAHFSV